MTAPSNLDIQMHAQNSFFSEFAHKICKNSKWEGEDFASSLLFFANTRELLKDITGPESQFAGILFNMANSLFTFDEGKGPTTDGSILNVELNNRWSLVAKLCVCE